MIFFITLFAMVFYFLPSVIALASGKKQIVPIVLTNVFLGWTVIGWLAALIWASSKD